MKRQPTLSLLGALVLFACGQGPSFMEKKGLDSMTGTKNNSGQDEDSTASKFDDFRPEDEIPAVIDENGQIIRTTGTTDASGKPKDPVVVGPDEGYKLPPVVSDSDAAALHGCLMSLKGQLPPKFAYYRKITAQVAVGASGAVINDTLRTDAPELLLIVAGVNVGGTPTYNFLNPNGFYCIKVGVNVLTALTVNLHCNARLADSRINVNVGSNTHDTTAAVGVAVMSDVKVKVNRPVGDACLR